MTEEEKKLQQQNNQQNNQQNAAPAVQTGAQNNQQSTAPAPDTYNQAMSALQANAKPMYNASYDGQIQNIYNQIVNRDKFAYDINADALYQQAKDNYVNMGRLAMKDTLGQAAALTGGYGSTYGQAVGQQAYDASLQGLYDNLPDYYDRAYQRWMGEGEALTQQYAMLGDLADDEYGKYQDAYNRFMNERDYNYGRLVDMINATGYKPTPEEISAAGMTQEQVDQLLKLWKIQNPGLYNQMNDISGGGDGPYYDGGDSELDAMAAIYDPAYDGEASKLGAKVTSVGSGNVANYIASKAADAGIKALRGAGYSDEQIRKFLEG